MPPKKDNKEKAGAAKAPFKESQTLPPMLQPTFKAISVRCFGFHFQKLYEDKQYKKAMKSAETILKKFPNHGGSECLFISLETLALKGLLINAQRKKEEISKRDEAVGLVMEGIKHNPESFVSWHILGLIHRSDRKYELAISCYRRALKLNKVS